jgi:hypothetical protein
MGQVIKMEDQGEKIVNLASEMLRANPETLVLSDRFSISFKMLCLATLLAAAGGGFVTARVNEAMRPLTHYERVELDALIFYAARIKGINEEILRQEIVARTGVNNFDDLTEYDFQAAKTYLQGEIR